MADSSSRKRPGEPSFSGSPEKKGPAAAGGDKGKERVPTSAPNVTIVDPKKAVNRIDVTFTLPFAGGNSSRKLQMQGHPGPLSQEVPQDSKDPGETVLLPNSNALVAYLERSGCKHVQLIEVCFKLVYAHEHLLVDLKSAMSTLTPLLEWCKFGFRTIMVGECFKRYPYDVLEAVKSHEAIVAMFRSAGVEQFPGQQVKRAGVVGKKVWLKGEDVVYGLVTEGGEWADNSDDKLWKMLADS